MKSTLLITTFNRGSLLKQNLERLTKLTLPDEVLIVDDGSSDDTESICKSFSNTLPIKYIYNHNPKWSICSMARNIGVKNCIGDVIITAEPEMIFVTDVIKQLLEDFDNYSQHFISVGTIYHAQAKTPIHPLIAIDPKKILSESVIDDYEIVRSKPYTETGYVKTIDWIAMFIALYKKNWLMELGGWDEGFEGAWGWDDVDLSTRLRQNGVNQFNDKSIVAIHQWHTHLPPNIQGNGSIANEKYMKDKNLISLKKGDIGLIANKGKEWGVIIPKP